MRFREINTPQKIFNKVAKHLLFSPKVAKYVFVDKDGNTCAIGSLFSTKVKKNIRDEKDSGQDEELKRIEHIWALGTDESLDVIYNINDYIRPSRRPQALRKLAKELNLKIPDFLKRENCGR